MDTNLDLFRNPVACPVPAIGPDLGTYDCILVNTSAGKDSQAMLDIVCERAKAIGILDRVVAVHCDLTGMEWPGTRELAQRQAEHYGIRFEVVRRDDTILEYVLRRHAKRPGSCPWPSPKARWCTSDFKRGPVQTLITRLATEVRSAGRGRARILNCMGMRAEESPGRRKLIPFSHSDKASNGRRHVDTWLPVHHLLTAEVWARIRASGVEYHPAYSLGMGRLSCVACIYAPRAQLVLACRHNMDLFERYASVEHAVGYRFRQDLSVEEVLAQAKSGEPVSAEEDNGCWNM